MYNRKRQRYPILLFMLIMIFSLFVSTYGQVNAKDKSVVFFVPLSDSVNKGLYEFLDRAIMIANEKQVDHIVLEIDTPGGAVDAAGDIAKLLRTSEIPITAYVTKKAWSAGAYIALNCDQIVMKPSTTMGSAAVITSTGEAADIKAQSAWLSEMAASAQLNGRDPLYAKAMADKEITIPELGLDNENLLTLTAKQAKEVGYAEAIVDDRQALLDFLGYSDAKIEEINPTFAEKLARFVTHPIIVPILLSIGSLGLVLELYTPGFGVSGTIGLTSLLLFFFGHMIAGLAGWESLIIFIIGLGLVIAELFVPGGIVGAIGIVAIFGGIIMAGGNLSNILFSILIALTVTTIVSIWFIKRFGYRGPLRRLVLFDSTTTESGYVSNKTRSDLIGLEGKTLTPLRPSGTMIIEDERLDVVTEGSFINKDRLVKIIKTEGGRIVVRELHKNKED